MGTTKHQQSRNTTANPSSTTAATTNIANNTAISNNTAEMNDVVDPTDDCSCDVFSRSSAFVSSPSSSFSSTAYSSSNLAAATQTVIELERKKEQIERELDVARQMILSGDANGHRIGT